MSGYKCPHCGATAPDVDADAPVECCADAILPRVEAERDLLARQLAETKAAAMCAATWQAVAERLAGVLREVESLCDWCPVCDGPSDALDIPGEHHTVNCELNNTLAAYDALKGEE